MHLVRPEVSFMYGYTRMVVVCGISGGSGF